MQSYPNVTFDTQRAKEFFMDKVSYSLGPVELKKMLEKDLEKFNLIDLRDYQSYLKGHIPFAMHLPPEEIDEHWNMFEEDKINIVYCYNPFCHLAAKNAIIIAEKGYPVMELCGGFYAWDEVMGFDVVTDISSQEQELE